MRLIDADTLSKTWQEVLDCHENEKDSVGYLAFELFIKRLKDEPTIDPVHAAGGCYCRECKKFNTNRTVGLCLEHRSAVKADDFCSYGRRREDANGMDKR